MRSIIAREIIQQIIIREIVTGLLRGRNCTAIPLYMGDLHNRQLLSKESKVRYRTLCEKDKNRFQPA